MSQLKLCQSPICHTHKTKDRIRGSKGNKHYETRKRSRFYYGNNNFCSLMCQDDWFREYGTRAIDHFGRTREPKRTDASSAWYKDYTWGRDGNHAHYFANDLLGEHRPITEQQYNDENLRTPSLVLDA